MRRYFGSVSRIGLILIAFFGFTAGCATPGERFPVSLSYRGEPPSILRVDSADRLWVFPFEDHREESDLVGRRERLFGRVDIFPSNEPAGQRVAELLVASLRQRGWEAEMAPSGLSPLSVAEGRVDHPPDFWVTGAIQSLWAQATSHFGYTEINAHLTMSVEVHDRSTGAKTSIKVARENAPKVVVFRPEALVRTLNELISGGVDRVLH